MSAAAAAVVFRGLFVCVLAIEWMVCWVDGWMHGCAYVQSQSIHDSVLSSIFCVQLCSIEACACMALSVSDHHHHLR